ncbi:MAG TPA: MerR family transcriptional regulator [Candidatus Limnocylindria bacterium]|nr:MerR family transcriptional regulator [Candidatus Limnocylindria bacterium]
MFQIAAFARLGGVSPKVLRDYDELGLFRPAWVDRLTGYRLYSAAQLPQLRRILALRDLGTGLPEIRALVVDGADLRAVLEQRRAALVDARRELDRRLAGLGISLAAAQEGQAGPDVVVRDIGGELVATMDVARVDGDVGRAFYELELRIRDAGVRAAGPPGALVRERPGPGMQPETEVFVPVGRSATGLDVRRLPVARAATLLHEGSYETMAATRRALDEWCIAAGLRPLEPIRLLYLQFGAEEDLRLPRQYLVTRAAELVTEIQLPIDG